MSIELMRVIRRLEDKVEELEARDLPVKAYRGTSGVDFTTTTLPNYGDYGYQTADAELQINCDGTIRAVGITAV